MTIREGVVVAATFPPHQLSVSEAQLKKLIKEQGTDLELGSAKIS